MNNTISIGELRQNPTRMLRDVRAGATYTITDHGEPVADVVTRRTPRWVSANAVDEVLRELGADVVWAGELAADRAAVDVTDPWDSTR